MKTPELLKLQSVLEQEPSLELAVLVGSRADNRAHENSNWDNAIQWKREISAFDNLADTETLRRKLAKSINVDETKIDLINIPSAKLAMRAVIAEEGLMLKGEDDLAWNHLLSRTWRELEIYEWEKQNKL